MKELQFEKGRSQTASSLFKLQKNLATSYINKQIGQIDHQLM